jgi:hypothetical protein
MPARDIGDAQLGAGAGVSLTTMKNAHVGVGLDPHGCSPVVLGLDATFRHVRFHDKGWTGVNDLSDFSALTVGALVPFGRE